MSNWLLHTHLNVIICDGHTDKIFDCFPHRGMLQESRLLNFSTGLEYRFYPQWSYRVLNLPSLAKGEQYQTNDTIEQTVRPHLCETVCLNFHVHKVYFVPYFMSTISTQYHLKAGVNVQ